MAEQTMKRALYTETDWSVFPVLYTESLCLNLLVLSQLAKNPKYNTNIEEFN